MLLKQTPDSQERLGRTVIFARRQKVTAIPSPPDSATAISFVFGLATGLRGCSWAIEVTLVHSRFVEQLQIVRGGLRELRESIGHRGTPTRSPAHKRSCVLPLTTSDPEGEEDCPRPNRPGSRRGPTTMVDPCSATGGTTSLSASPCPGSSTRREPTAWGLSGERFTSEPRESAFWGRGPKTETGARSPTDKRDRPARRLKPNNSGPFTPACFSSSAAAIVRSRFSAKRRAGCARDNGVVWCVLSGPE
jgi:hypothetical protein